jgi:hypothetical protein
MFFSIEDDLDVFRGKACACIIKKGGLKCNGGQKTFLSV